MKAIVLLALVMITGGCNVKKPDPTADIFEGRLRENGIKFEINQQGLYVVRRNGETLTINLENIAREYNRSKDAEAVRRFADRLLTNTVPAELSWDEVTPCLRFSIEPDNYVGGFEDVVHKTLSDGLVCVYVFTTKDGANIVWIPKGMLSKWGVTEQRVRDIAETNMRKIVDLAKIEYKEIDGVKLGMISTTEYPFKASLLFSDRFRNLVEPTLGFPVYAVAPCRDFVYVIPHTNHEFLVRLGSVVKREFEQSGHSLTMNVLEVSDKGVEVIGTFATKEKNSK